MEHFLAIVGPALLTAVVAILLNRLDREKNSGRFAGVVETGLAALREDVNRRLDESRDDMNRRFDEIRENQKSAWAQIDLHNREIGRLEGKLELLKGRRSEAPHV